MAPQLAWIGLGNMGRVSLQLPHPQAPSKSLQRECARTSMKKQTLTSPS